MKKTLVLAVVAGVMWANSVDVRAANYYVDGTNGNDSNPGNISQPWQTINKANSTLQAGDVVCLRGGTYSERIEPSNSGSSGNPITYIADNQYGAIISTNSHGANLSGKSYIILDGLYFNNCGHRWILITNGDYNIIQNCKFYDANAWTGILLEYGSDYNKIIDNIFEDAPASGNNNGTSPADFIGLCNSINNNYNVIEGNTFGDCNHNIMFIDFGDHTIIRGNAFQNQYHTGLNLNDDGPNLIENNYFYDQGKYTGSAPIPDKPDMRNNPGIQLNGTYNIIRKNTFDNNGSGISQSTYASANTEASYNRVYNNTMNKGITPLYGEAVDANYMVNNTYKNNTFTNPEASSYPGDSYPEPFNLNYRDNNGTGNRFYNNCSYGQNVHRYRNYTPYTFAEIISQFPTNFPSGNITTDPKYTNVSNRDFTLQSDSSLIDAGTFLTIITSPTVNSQTSFTVDDAGYFYDGWGMPGEAGDIIKTENGQVTTIQSINYDTNTITVSPAINIIKNEGIALNYSGSAPDIGAFEFTGINIGR